MNLEKLYYLLQKVRHQGTEESTFLGLGFCEEQAYYDENNNFMFGYRKVGDSSTIFTCHLDTVESYRAGTTKSIYRDPITNHIFADNRVLGADNGAGVALLCHMIEQQVAGHYFFFAAEEVGGFGSDYLANNFNYLFPELTIERAIAFDRKGTNEVIISQMYGQCCSDSFAASLCSSLGNTYELAHGTFTDTANLAHFIPECTNVSVGYFNEHSKQEYLDLNHLLELAKTVCLVDWEKLPSNRVIQPTYFGNFDAKIFKKV